MTTKQTMSREATNERAKESPIPEMKSLLQAVALEREPKIEEGIEKTIVARIDAYQKAVIKSVEALCANALANSRDIERLNCIVASLPETNSKNTDLRRILASIENGGSGAGLSKRQKGVLAQLVCGKSNKEISEALGISDKTVKNHLWKIYRKLGVGNRSQLFHKLIA